MTALEDFVGYANLGSTLRGAFGRGLKRAACTVRHGECHRCFLNSACHYTRLFEPIGGSDLPRPLIFRMPVPLLVAGQSLHIGIKTNLGLWRYEIRSQT